jgi:hypothetical protein
MQKLLAAVALVATFASAAGRPIELPTGASASLVGDPGGLKVGTGGGMMNSGGGMGFMGAGMNSGGVGAGPRDTKCAYHHTQSKNSPNPMNPLSWLSQCAK